MASAGPVDAIEVVSLSKSYDGVPALDDVTFSLRRGALTGLLGPNGAGKTTLMRLLLGMAEPTAGSALIFGRRYRDLDDPARRVGAMLESDDFHPGRSGHDHLRSIALAARVDPERVDHVLALVDLTDAARRRVKGYSLGMRQRLGLAAALLGEPELLILDEPANGLDPAGIRWLRTFLRRFADEGGTVLISSHALSEVAQTVEQVVIIDRGRSVASVSLADIGGEGRDLEEIYLTVTGGAGE